MHYFIVNPIAGSSNGKDALIKNIQSVCDKRKVDYHIYVTQSHGDATAFVRNVCEENHGKELRFYACGGDGTLNEVANGVIGYENVEFASIPAGTGNDFIKSFSDNELFTDIERQLDGNVFITDAIKFGNKYCVNLLNIGFDCKVVENMRKYGSRKLIPRKLAYPLGVISSFFGKLGAHFSVTFDGDTTEDGTFLLAAFGNGRVYGGGYHATPEALIDDGLLDVCLVKKISRGTFVSLLGDYKKGSHILREKPLDFITYRKCKKVTIKADTDTGVCFDGELGTFCELNIEIIPKVLRFAVPRGSVCLTGTVTDAPENNISNTKQNAHKEI